MPNGENRELKTENRSGMRVRYAFECGRGLLFWFRARIVGALQTAVARSSPGLRPTLHGGSNPTCTRKRLTSSNHRPVVHRLDGYAFNSL